MKKMFFVFFASIGFAALPPLAQSTREIQALLSDAQFYQSFGSGEFIKEISRNEMGYLVVTQHYTMQVDIQYVKNHGFAGPAQFVFSFHEPLLTSP